MPEYFFGSREDAEHAWEAAKSIMNAQGVISVADFKELIGFGHQMIYVDLNYGWLVLNETVNIKQTREGYVLELPEPVLIKRQASVDSRHRAYRSVRPSAFTYNQAGFISRGEPLSRDDQIRIAALSAAVRLNPEVTATSMDVVVRALHFEAYLKGEEV